MIIYNVTVSIDYDIHQNWLKWMKENTYSKCLSYRLFLENKIAKIHAEEERRCFLQYSIFIKILGQTTIII